MAPSPVDYPTLLSQLPFVSKLATAEQTHLSVRQELFGPMLLKEQQKKDKEEVPEVNPKEEASTVTRDGAGNSQQQAAQDKNEQDQTDDELETNPSSGSPWTGNIINKKI